MIRPVVAYSLPRVAKRIWSAIPPLESKLPGENKYFRSRQGIVFYKESGDGETPVVFIHGIGAGNTSYEWSQNFGAISDCASKTESLLSTMPRRWRRSARRSRKNGEGIAVFSLFYEPAAAGD